MAEDQIRNMQKIELIIAKEVKRICEKNNIKYFMVAGTMLGAIRHKGFIPWDDDMDFGLLRDDYELFIECCTKDLKKEFTLQTWNNDNTYPFPFIKIRLKGTYVEETLTKSVDTNKEIGIDIFPFDYIIDNERIQKKHFRKCNFYEKILWLKKGWGIDIKNHGFKSKIKYYIARFISIFFNYNKTKLKLEKLMTKYNDSAKNKIYFLTIYGFKQSIYDEIIFREFDEYKFENIFLKGVKNYDSYLTCIYGNYLELPPIEKRYGHHFMNVDFGKYLMED